MSREDITFELSNKVLAKLRREFELVAQEVWVDERHRVDFVAFRTARGELTAGSIEHGRFCFVEVKSCMDDFNSGHGLTFDGDDNWLVCPRDLCEKLRRQRLLPRPVSVVCPDRAGNLRKAIEMTGGDYPMRTRCSSELLWRMIRHSAVAWRTQSEVFRDEQPESWKGGELASSIHDLPR